MKCGEGRVPKGRFVPDRVFEDRDGFPPIEVCQSLGRVEANFSVVVLDGLKQCRYSAFRRAPSS